MLYVACILTPKNAKNILIHQAVARLCSVQPAQFPANSTNIMQPMDQGVIHCLKVHYQKLLIRRLITIDVSNSLREAAKSITILDAINFLNQAVKG